MLVRCAPVSGGSAVAGGVVWVIAMLVGTSALLRAQEPAYKSLKINEIIANNNTVEPTNCVCDHVDMIEIYNPSEVEQVLLYEDVPVQGPRALRLTDGSTDANGAPIYFAFQPGHKINPKGRFVVFCDGPIECKEISGCDQSVNSRWIGEADAPFKLDRDGETVTLLGFQGEVIDSVAFPPLAADESYGRYPDGADTWISNSRSTVSFGSCARPQTLPGLPVCPGSKNLGGSNVAPRISLVDYSVARPVSGQPVVLTAEVRDEKLPDPNDIDRVQIVYRLDGGPEETAAMSFVRIETADENLLNQWAIWQGEIPGATEGTVVDFTLRVVDRDGGQGIGPDNVCPWPKGPCEPDADGNFTPPCDQACQAPYRYQVGLAAASAIVLNEVVAENRTIVKDKTETVICTDMTETCHFDDCVELYNAASSEFSLAGLVLTTKPFQAWEGWAFPDGAKIAAGGHLIVWVDGDGRDVPNPNNVAKDEYHTDFTIDGNSDQIYLFTSSTTLAGHGVYQEIDGVRWGRSIAEIRPQGTFVPSGDSWRYFKGVASAPPNLPDPDGAPATLSWLHARYSDAAWLQGSASFGYGPGVFGTTLADMKGLYLTTYFRRTFTVPDSLFEVVDVQGTELIRRVLFERLYLEVNYSDGFRASINGRPVAVRNLRASAHDSPASGSVAKLTELFDVSEAKDLLAKGAIRNVLTVEVHNAALDAADFFFDARLFYGTRGMGADESLSRIPDGAKTGRWETLPKEFASPGAGNTSPAKAFRRGDASIPTDGSADISDAIAILSYLFLGSATPSCLDAADVDDSGGIDIGDGINLLSFLFQSGKTPPSPGPEVCGPDPTDDTLLDCEDPRCP